jgi:hypothetical protein
MSTPWSSPAEVDLQSERPRSPDPLPVRAAVAAIALQSRLDGCIVQLITPAVTHGDLRQSGELIHPPEPVQRVDVSPRGGLERINRRSL